MPKKLIVIVFLLCGVLFAQRNRGSQNTMDDSSFRTPAVPNTLDILSTTLNLNKDQKKLIKTILDEGQKQAVPLRDQIAGSRLRIGESVESGVSAPELDQAIIVHADLDAQMTQIEMQCFAKVFTALDVDQRNKVGPVFRMMRGIFMGKNWNEAQ
jgi:hypothetical protein